MNLVVYLLTYLFYLTTNKLIKILLYIMPYFILVKNSFTPPYSWCCFRSDPPFRLFFSPSRSSCRLVCRTWWRGRSRGSRWTWGWGWGRQRSRRSGGSAPRCHARTPPRTEARLNILPQNQNKMFFFFSRKLKVSVGPITKNSKAFLTKYFLDMIKICISLHFGNS